MIIFSFYEIFLSVIYSVSFGGLLAILYEFFRTLTFLPETISMIFNRNSFSHVGKMYASEQTIAQKIFFFFCFTLGSILLSYYSLDGMVRMYLIILSITGFALVRKVAFYSLEWAIYTILSVCFYPLAKLWRKKRL